MKAVVVVFLLCVSGTLTEDSFENTGVRTAFKVYDECSKVEIFSCLKKKAILLLDRLSKMEKISLVEGVTIVKAVEVPQEKPNTTENELERNLSKEETLNEMIAEKLTRLVGSRRIEISLPKIFSKFDEGKEFYLVKFISIYLCLVSSNNVIFIPTSVGISKTKVC